MRGERDFVARVQGLGRGLQRRVGIAHLLEAGQTRLVQRGLQFGGDTVGIQCAAGAVVPLDVDRCQRALGVPVGVGHHRNAVADLHDVFDPWHRARLGGIETRHLAAEGGALRQRGNQHAGHLDVDAELGRPVDLGCRVQPRHRLADVAEVFRRFQLGLFGRRQLGGRFSQLAIAGLLPARPHHPRVLGFASRRVDLPALGRRLHKHGARLRPRHPQLVVSVFHRGGTARQLAANHGVDVGLTGWRHLDLDLGDVDFEFFSQQHGH